MPHWHDTPLFKVVLNRRVEALKAKDTDEASYLCLHICMDEVYFMREPKSGRTWFLCRACCARNVELELLRLDKPPIQVVA